MSEGTTGNRRPRIVNVCLLQTLIKLVVESILREIIGGMWPGESVSPEIKHLATTATQVHGHISFADVVAACGIARNLNEWIQVGVKSSYHSCREQTAHRKRAFGMMIRGSSNDL